MWLKRRTSTGKKMSKKGIIKAGKINWAIKPGKLTVKLKGKINS